MKAHSEFEYANDVQSQLEASGWDCRPSSDYNARFGLLPADLVGFLEATQPGHYGHLAAAGNDQLVADVRNAISKVGAAQALKHGVDVNGRHIQLCGFKPQSAATAASTHNDYRHNRFSFVRELVFTPGGEALRLDFALFLNGIPLFTFELKSEMSAQSWTDAVFQYRRDRKPELGLILKPVEGALAHFAASQEAVAFTTRLAGDDTVFLPFNPTYGYSQPSHHTYPTDYLWRDVMAPDSVLDLLEYFIFQKPTARGLEVLFPRFHQWECIHQVKAAVLAYGPGQRYLQQHSAGSGKSNTIAWLASQLAYLTLPSGQKVFDKVLVVTDRLVLDRQLSDVLRFMHGEIHGQMVTCGHTRDLGEALQGLTPIVVTTVQKFAFLDQVFSGDKRIDPGTLARIRGLRFAILIDEAHSSQGGDYFSSMLKSLSTHLRSGREVPNVSFFAFTATPKNDTLELFGRKNRMGDLEPFHSYSMKQAIDERYILDVRKNYHQVETLFHVESTRPGEFIERTKDVFRAIFNDPEIVKAKAWEVARVFTTRIAPRLEGQAQGMVVCDSRAAAAQFKLAVDAILAEQGVPYKTLCAFTEDLELGGVRYDEFTINGLPQGSDLGRLFVEHPETYKLLVVAEKFQVGFDCPRLLAMFVDKPLDGIAAVQTLSRLNRAFPGKDWTDLVVLDFANEEETIMRAFDRFIDRRVTVPRNFIPRLKELDAELRGYGLFSDTDVDAFWRAARSDAAALFAVMGSLKCKVAEMDSRDRKQLVAQLAEFKELFALGSKLNPEALKHQRLAGFVSRMLATVDKHEAVRDACLPLKVVMASVVPYLPEDKAAFGADAGADSVVNGPAEPQERKSPAQKALDGFLQELSVKNLEGLATEITAMVNELCTEPKLITQARGNSFDVYEREGSAPKALEDLIIQRLVSGAPTGQALMDLFMGNTSRTRDARSNLLRVVYERSLKYPE